MAHKGAAYYLRRLVPHRPLKLMGYLLGVALALFEGWRATPIAGIIVFVLVVLVRIVDVAVSEWRDAKRGHGWDSYYSNGGGWPR